MGAFNDQVQNKARPGRKTESRQLNCSTVALIPWEKKKIEKKQQKNKPH